MSIIKQQTVGSRIFDVFNHLFLGIIGVAMIFPLIYVVVGSFSISGMIGGFNAFSLDAYKYIMTTNSLAKSTLNSVFITVVGTFINICMTSITAYALSKKYLRGRSVMMTIVVIFMLFNPGMIPQLSGGVPPEYDQLFLESLAAWRHQRLQHDHHEKLLPGVAGIHRRIRKDRWMSGSAGVFQDCASHL